MRWLSRLSVVLIICLVAIGVPAVPAQAAGPYITLSPSSGVPGTEVTVRGYNFTADEWVDVYYYYADTARTLETETKADGEGYFKATFTIRESYTGVHKVRAQITSTNYTEANFTVKPGLTVTPEEGPVGTNVTVEGHGFARDETSIELMYYLDGTAQTVVQDITADEDGWWKRSFLVPASSRGNHKIDAHGDDSSLSQVGDASFQVKPGIALGKSSGSPGQNVTMTGSGFAAMERDITILFAGEEVKTEIRADEAGYWQEDFEVPYMPKGTHSVTAEGESTPETAISARSFNITPGLVLSPDEGHVGTDVAVIGGGFPISKDVVVKYEAAEVGRTSTNSSGSFRIVFPLPESQHGENEVTAEDTAGNNVTAVFTLESEPPGTPELDSLPDGSRLGFIGWVRPTFNWSAVADDSGVYYSLQIATTANVTAEGFANPVVSVTGIAATNYTLNKTQALPFGTYYWIVQAVDGAGNTGDWTGAYSFHAGVLPLWAFVLIIVVIVALIGTLVYFFVIRRRIYYY
ncbi:MAG: hypothetical protein OEV57_06545 [Dehalococcoidia bacterium]|nr:hypothetical protein [Dehalococcoidia bacterium]